MSSQSFSQLITVNVQYSGIKTTKQCSDVNCLKNILIRDWSVPYYSTFWVRTGTGTYSVSLHIKSNLGKKFELGKNSEHGHFLRSGQVLWFISLNLILCLHLKIFSFLWFRRSFPWFSVLFLNINNKYLFFLLVGIFLKYKIVLEAVLWVI